MAIAWGPGDGPARFMALPLVAPQLLGRADRDASQGNRFVAQGFRLRLTDILTMAIVGRFAPHPKRAIPISRLHKARTVARATIESTLDGPRFSVVLPGSEPRLTGANPRRR
jgi:hypothetical protein